MAEQVVMRDVYIETLASMMEKDDRIVVLDADLGKGMGTLPLYKRFPDRTVDVGIAEQNMIGVAAGLAAYGFIPVTGTFAAFAARRVCDQISVSVSFADNRLKMVGSDGGILAQLNGATHMANEDIGVLRSIPNITIFDFCDAVSLKKALPELIYSDRPVYMRLFRKKAETVYTDESKFELMKAGILREGSDVTLFASGIEVQEACKAAALLEEDGVQAEVIDIHTIKPIDAEAVVSSVRKTGAAVTCDNHNIIGGMGSAVCEVLAKEYPVPVEMIGVRDHIGEASPLDYLIVKYHMTAEDIAEAAKKAIQRKNAQ